MSDENLKWRVLYSTPGGERRTLDMLQDAGLEGYAPMERYFRGKGKQTQPAERPLIPRYVFAQLRDEDIHIAAHLKDLHGRGVQRMIYMGERPALVQPRFIERLQQDEARGKFDKTGAIANERRLRAPYVGQEVNIVSGPYAGRAATISRLNNSRRVQIVMSCITFDTDIDLERLEATAQGQTPRRAA